MRIIPPLARFEAHPVRLLLQEFLRTVQTGAVISYVDLSKEAELDVRAHEHRHLLYSAREALLDEGIVFDVIPNVGLKRTDSAGALAVVEGQTRKIVSAARRGRRQMTAVDLDLLSPTERMRFGVAQVWIGIVQQFSKRATSNKIEKVLHAGGQPAQVSEAVVGSLKQFE